MLSGLPARKAMFTHFTTELSVPTRQVLRYIDLARAKSEALDNIYSLFKQNI